MAELFTGDYIQINDSSGTSATIHFRNIVEWINEGIFCVNGEGKILYANDQFCRNLGYKRDEIIGSLIFDYFWNEDQIKISKQKLELRKKGLSDVYEIIMKKKTGEAIWVRLSGKPVFDSNGNFVATVTIQADITKPKLLEDELRNAKEDLEIKVITRTRELSEANLKLNEQIRERKLAEISKLHTEKRFRDIYINSPDAIYIESLDGIILDVNAATCKLHHADENFLIGKSIFDVSPPEVHEVIRKRQPKLISGEITKFESECVTKEGEIIPIEISTAKIQFKDKPALLMHVRDISARKATERLQLNLNDELEKKVLERTAELEAANQKLTAEIQAREQIQQQLETQKNFLRQIIDSIPNLLFVKNPEGKFLLANKAVADFYGKTTAQMEGHYDDVQNFTQEEIEYFAEQDKQTLASDGDVNFPERAFTHIRKNEVVWLSTTKKTIPSLTENEKNILGVATDVTTLKKAKEELALSEQLYRALAGNLPKAAMFIFDKEMRYVVAEGPLIGIVSRPKAEIEGKTVHETIRSSEVETVVNMYREILTGKEREFEQTFFGRILRINHIPIRNENGEIVYGMVMIFDISDIKQAQRELEVRAEQLERSNEELERFAYVASHDLQGPLRTIASYLQLLEMRYKDKLDGEASEFIRFSVSGAKRMQLLIQDLLTYSRLSNTPKPFATVDLSEVLNTVQSNLEATIHNSRTQINVPDNMPAVFGDATQLVQLFQNLIDNGIKFVKERNPVITVHFNENPNEWQFSVSDNGIGIREEFKEKIFQIFQRLHNDTEYTGTGIGLAICKKIVQLHNGRIWFDSREGDGTTFHFTIQKPKEETQD